MRCLSCQCMFHCPTKQRKIVIHKTFVETYRHENADNDIQCSTYPIDRQYLQPRWYVSSFSRQPHQIRDGTPRKCTSPRRLTRRSMHWPDESGSNVVTRLKKTAPPSMATRDRYGFIEPMHCPDYRRKACGANRRLFRVKKLPTKIRHKGSILYVLEYSPIKMM